MENMQALVLSASIDLHHCKTLTVCSSQEEDTLGKFMARLSSSRVQGASPEII